MDVKAKGSAKGVDSLRQVPLPPIAGDVSEWFMNFPHKEGYVGSNPTISTKE